MTKDEVLVLWRDKLIGDAESMPHLGAFEETVFVDTGSAEASEFIDWLASEGLEIVENEKLKARACRANMSPAAKFLWGRMDHDSRERVRAGDFWGQSKDEIDTPTALAANVVRLNTPYKESCGRRDGRQIAKGALLASDRCLHGVVFSVRCPICEGINVPA